MDKIKNIINKFEKEKIICIPHYSADLDAIASAYILNATFGIDIGLLNRPLEKAANFIQLFNVDVKNNVDIDSYDLVIFVDSCDIIQFDNIKPKNSIIIDHHFGEITHPIPNTIYSIIKKRSEYVSCTSVLDELLYAGKMPITPLIASAIIAGFIGDGGWISATNKIRTRIEDLIKISEFPLTQISNLNSHAKIHNKDDIDEILSTLTSIEYFNENNADIAFVSASNRNDFFYIYDNLLVHLNIDIIISKIEENNNNIVRIEKIDNKFKESFDVPLWLNHLRENINHNYFKIEYGRLSTKEHWNDVKLKIKNSFIS